MKQLVYKIVLLGILYSSVELTSIQSVYAQSPSLLDSLRLMLTPIGTNTKDSILQNAVKEAQTAYTTNIIDSTLSKTLLTLDSILVNGAPVNDPLVLPYATTLAQLLKELSPGQESPGYATGLSNLAYLYYQMGQYARAMPLMVQAMAIRKKVLGEQHPDYATSLNNLALLYRKMGQYDKSLPLSEQALSIRKKVLGEQHPDYATSLNNLAVLYRKMAQFDKSLLLVEQALAIRKKVLGEQHLDYAESLSNLAVLYDRTGHYDKALPLFEQALTIRKNALGEQHPYYAESLSNLAFIYLKIGQYDKALSLFIQASIIRKNALGEQHPDYAESLSNLAVLYYQMGQYDKALPLVEQALAIRKKVLGEQHPDYARSLNNMAFLYSKMGQYDIALALFEKALIIRKKALGVMHPEYAQSLSNLAGLYLNMGLYDKALPIMVQILAYGKNILGEQHSDYATILNNLAVLYNDMGQYYKALPLLVQALAINKKISGEQHPDYARSLHDLATTYYYLREYNKALPLFETALAIRRKTLGEQHPDYAESLNSLGKLYASISQPTQASTLFSESAAATLKYLNQTYVTLSEQEKIKLLQSKASQFDYLPSLLYTQGAEQPFIVKQVYANELALKGMVLEDQKEVLNSIRKSGDSSILHLYEQWQFNKAFIGKQLLLPLSKRIPYMDSLLEATNQLEQELSRSAASFRNFQQSQHITANDISQKLLKGEAAIEFIRFHLFNKKWTDSTMYAALVFLPGDSTAHFIPLFEEKQLKRLLKPYLSANNSFAQFASIKKLYDESSYSASSSLYQLLWKPLKPYLEGIHTVYYAPAGMLHYIAFNALPTDATHRLIDTYQLHQVLSTRSVVLPSSTIQKPQSVALWGNIDYNTHPSTPVEPSINTSPSNAIIASSFNVYTPDSFRTRGDNDRGVLPGAKRELDSLAALFQLTAIQVSIDSGTAATEEAFKALSGKSPQLMHLATHGFFLPIEENKPKSNECLSTVGGSTFTIQQNPMFRSGLVLAGGNLTWRGEKPVPGREDGILTAYEIAQMDLSSTEMVVLSACETALGDVQGSEGVIGLQRAFKLAGVKQLVMSLWQVPDEATMELMTLFYSNWIRGQSPQDALRKAQLKMKEKYAPFYWAAFVVVE